MCDFVGGVERIAAEEAVQASRVGVGAGLRDRLDLDSDRPSLRDVELTRDDLEFGDRIPAERRLTEARSRELLGDLLAVEVELKEVVVAHARLVRDVVGRDALDHHRQFHPVAALQRQFLHLPSIDIARHLRRRDVHERRFGGHREHLADGRHFQRERYRAVLPDEQFDIRNDDRREAGELGLKLVPAGRQLRQTVFAALVGDCDRQAAGVQIG